MSINDKLWRFFSDPVENPNSQTQNKDPDTEQPPQQDPDQTPGEPPSKPDEDGLTNEELAQKAAQQAAQTAASQPMSTTKDPVGKTDPFDWANQRKELDETYWPYAFTPDGFTERIGPDEVIQQGTFADGSEEVFAGQWVREMFEAHDPRPDDNTWVGYTQDNVRGVQEAGIEYKSLFRHMAFFGMTGYGKSTVLKNLMVQWAFMGYGFCFIDPKGQDILELLQLLPEDRLKDVVWVEPGNEELSKSVGFNFFDTRHDPGENGFENEVQEIVNDFVAILRQDGAWGPTMDAVAKSVTTQLVRAQEENFTVLDMYQILSDEDERATFADRYGDAIEQVYLKRLKENYEDEEFDPLLRRIREWAENRITREMVAHRESTINIGEVVEEGKILLVRTSSIPSTDVMSLVATSIVRRIWATIRTRANMDSDDYNPFFIVMDEFDMLTNGEMDIGDMFSKGRSLRLSVCVANQQPTQLPEEVQEALNNCDNLFTFNPGQNNIQDAKNLGKSFDVDMMELFELSQFSLLGRFTVDGNKTDAILVNTFAPYPPRRTEMVADAVMERSIDKYGANRLDKDFDFSTFGILGRERNEDENDEDRIELDGGNTVTIPQVLETVHTAGVRNGTRTINEKDGWTAIDGIRTEVAKYTDALDDGVTLDNILEKIPATLLDDATVGETTYYRLTTEGEEKAFVQDTGLSSSGGKAGHRHLLKKGYEAFTRLGYSVTLPTQEGGEQPDGVATPPIQPMKESETFEEAEKLKTKLERKYGRLFELYGDNTVAIEAESTTLTKPKQTIKNLSKAMDNDQKCVFLVKDATESKGTFEYWARYGHGILANPAFARYKDDDGNRRFYNNTTDNPIKLSNDGYALRENHSSDTVWRDDGDRIVLEDPDNRVKHTGTGVLYTYSYSKTGAIILRDPDGNEYNTRFPSWSTLKASGDFEETNIPLAIFKKPHELNEPSASKFPYNYSYNQSAKEYVVRDSRGNTIETYSDKDSMLKDFDIIPKPVVPENIFPSGDYPDDDDWMFIVIPDATKNTGPQIYRGKDDSGNSILEPLFEGDDPYNANGPTPETNPDDEDADDDDDDDGTPQTSPKTDGENKPENPGTGDTGNDEGENRRNPKSLLDDLKDNEPDTDEDDGDAPVASNDKPKSTNDVVKNSDEVWTKPDPGDDEYDPTKDNSNYHTGYKEDGVGEDWTGGLAREEDDGSMKDYRTPDEKAEERLRDEWAKEKGIGPHSDQNDTDETNNPSEVQSTENDEEQTSSTQSDTGADPFNDKNLSRKRLQRKRKKREREDKDESADSDN